MKGVRLSTGVWLGRVFGEGSTGGNHTAVVMTLPAEPQAVATVLGFPDSAFVTHREGKAVTVRTFSPYEELAQCFQTSLAVPVALGSNAGDTYYVQHRARGLAVRVERNDDGWICWAQDQDAGQQTPEGVDDLPGWLTSLRPLSVLRVPQSRSRLYIELDSAAELQAPDPVLLRELCTAHGCTGIVFYDTSRADRVRTRVFTTSLACREDTATGGATAGLAVLLAGRGRRGRIPVLQGPHDPLMRGHLLMEVGNTVRIGGRVRPLLAGTTDLG